MSVASMSMSDPSHSRLASSATSGSATTGTESSFDDEMRTIRSRETVIFPLFSEMAQSRLVPMTFYVVAEFFCVLQFLATGFWASSEKVWPEDAKDGEVTHGVQCVIDFGLHLYTWENSLPFYIAFIAIAVATALWHLFVFKSFAYTHDFSRSQLIVTRVLHVVVTPVLLPVYGSMTGTAFRQLGNEILLETITPLAIVLLILSAAATLFMFYVYYISYGLSCSNPIACWESLVCAWDWRPWFCLVVVSSEMAFFAPIVDLFADWFAVLVAISVVLVYVFLVSLVRWFTFQKMWMNSVFLGLLCANVVTLVLAIVRMFKVNVSAIVVLVATIGAWILASILASVFLKISRKRIGARLMIANVPCKGKVNDAEKKAYFDSFVFHSASEVAAYMRVGTADNCDLVIDFSFHHYIIETYATPDICLLTAHMLSFFPSQLQFFGYCLGLIQKSVALGFIHHFLVFQMRKVHVMRQSSLSKEASSMIKKIRKQSRDAVSTVRSFWIDILNQPQRMDFGPMCAIYNLTHKIKGSFCDLTDRFTNSQELCDEYSYFLIEGMGDFVEGAKWAAKSQMLEVGKRLDKDFAFWSLMNLYPHYLIDKICDTHGAFTDMSKTTSEASYYASHNSSTMGSDGTGQDEHRMESMSKNLIRQPQLRVAVQLSLARLKMTGTKHLKIAGYGSVVIALIVYIVMCLIGPSVTNTITVILDEIKLSSDAYSNVAYTVFSCGLTYANHSLVKQFGGLESLYKYGDVAPGDVEFVVVSDMPGMTYSVSRTGKAHLLSFSQSMSAHRADRPYSAETLFSDLDPITYVQDGSAAQLSTVQEISTVRVGIPELLDTCANGATSLMDGTSDQQSANELFQGAWNLAYLLGHTEEFTNAVTQDASDIMNGYRRAFFNAEICLAVIFGVFLLALVINGIKILRADIMRVIMMMRAVKKDAVTKSLKPILKNSKEKTIVTGASQLVTQGNWPVIFLPAMLIFLVIMDSIGFSIAFLSCSTELSLAGEMLKWYDYSATRMGSILQIIGCMAMFPARNETEKQKLLTWIDAAVVRLQTANEVLLAGDDKISGLTGFDTRIDNMQFSDKCNTEISKFYQLGLCSSTEGMVTEAMILINSLVPLMKAGKFSLESKEFANLLILSDGPMNNDLYWFKEELLKVLNSDLLMVMNDLYITSGVMIGVNIIAAIIFTFVLLQFHHAVDGVKILLRLLPPEAILRNPDMLDLITQSQSSKQNQVLTPSQTIIKETNQGVMTVMIDYTISSVNKCFTEITGFTPDEVLGQGLSVVFPLPTSRSDSSGDNTSLTNLYECLESMKHHPDMKAAAFEVKYSSSSGREINAKLTVVPICYDETKLDSFSLLLQDLSQQTSKEQEYYNRKKRCERVMQKIIPPEVYQNEDQERLFISNSATIIWIEIDGLSDCVSAVSPLKIMEALGAIYDTLDEIVSRYVAIHVIKYNGTRIIACAGLFDYMDQPMEQVEESIYMCSELNKTREDLNERLALDLGFRCGVVMGNMLLGRVLSGDRPTFDLEGDMLDVAGKICSRCMPGDINVNMAIGQVIDKDCFRVTKAKQSKGETLEYYRIHGDSFQCEV